MSYYDADKFLALLKRAMGERSLNKFSAEINISKSYLSGILNGKYIPTRDMILRISKKAENGISYEELMNSLGYISSESEYYILKKSREMINCDDLWYELSYIIGTKLSEEERNLIKNIAKQFLNK